MDKFQRHFKDKFERAWFIRFKGSGEVGAKDDGSLLACVPGRRVAPLREQGNTEEL